MLLAVPTLLLVTIIVFFIVRFIPGDVVDQLAAEMATESGYGTELTAIKDDKITGVSGNSVIESY